MDFAVVARFALLLVRPGMVVSVAPGIGGAFLPVQVKVGLTVLLALGLLPSVVIPASAGSVPMLAAGLIAGVLVSMFQTVTSIQDNVLAFIPRAAAIFVVFALTFPWMLRVVTGFAAALIHRLPELVR